MNEISVKTLYPDGSTSPYRALALPAFASLCLMAGALLVLFRTWDELAVPRWALVLAAAAGYVSASAAHRLSRRRTAFRGGTARFICSASCRGYRRFSCRPHACAVSRHGFPDSPHAGMCCTTAAHSC